MVTQNAEYADTHPYTVDVWIVGAEPYPCVICGGWRQDPRHEQASPIVSKGTDA